jgi:hypothetical protein
MVSRASKKTKKHFLLVYPLPLGGATAGNAGHRPLSTFWNDGSIQVTVAAQPYIRLISGWATAAPCRARPGKK